jgi:exodeoxyribonuclease VII small subunit
MKPPPEKLLSFEVSLKELEKTVTELEKGDIPLDEQLKAFEKGVALSRDCLTRLEEVERRVEQLMKNSDAGLISVPFNAETPRS